MDASQTTLLNKQPRVLSLHCATEFFHSHLLLHEMSFSASVLPRNTRVRWSVTSISQCAIWVLTTGTWAGMYVCMHMHAYVYREMYVFLPSLLALFVNQSENKYLIKLKSPENSNKLIWVGNKKPVVAGGTDSQAVSCPVSTLPRL